MAIVTASLIPSVSSLTTSSYLWNYVLAADNDFHAAKLQSIYCQWVSHLYKFQDTIKVTRVLSYYGEHQGSPVLNEGSILFYELDFA